MSTSNTEKRVSQAKVYQNAPKSNTKEDLKYSVQEYEVEVVKTPPRLKAKDSAEPDHTVLERLPAEKGVSIPENTVKSEDAKYQEDFRKFLREILFRYCDIKEKYLDVFLSPENMVLFTKSFTSPTYDAENNYEIFEFLGDLSVNKTVCKYFYVKMKNMGLFNGDTSTGAMSNLDMLSRIKITYQSTKKLSEMARLLKFKDFIRYKDPEPPLEGAKYDKRKLPLDKNKLLEDVYEALCGCLEEVIDKYYSRTGYQVVENFITNSLDRIVSDGDLENMMSYDSMYDAKSRLNNKMGGYVHEAKVGYKTVHLLYAEDDLRGIILYRENGDAYSVQELVDLKKKSGLRDHYNMVTQFCMKFHKSDKKFYGEVAFAADIKHSEEQAAENFLNNTFHVVKKYTDQLARDIEFNRGDVIGANLNEGIQKTHLEKIPIQTLNKESSEKASVGENNDVPTKQSNVTGAGGPKFSVPPRGNIKPDYGVRVMAQSKPALSHSISQPGKKFFQKYEAKPAQNIPGKNANLNRDPDIDLWS